MPRVSGPRIVERGESKRGPRQHRRELRHLDQCTWARAARDGGKNSARPRRALRPLHALETPARAHSLSIVGPRKVRVGSLIMNTVYRTDYSCQFAVIHRPVRQFFACPLVIRSLCSKRRGLRRATGQRTRASLDVRQAGTSGRTTSPSSGRLRIGVGAAPRSHQGTRALRVAPRGSHLWGGVAPW